MSDNLLEQQRNIARAYHRAAAERLTVERDAENQRKAGIQSADEEFRQLRGTASKQLAQANKALTDVRPILLKAKLHLTTEPASESAILHTPATYVSNGLDHATSIATGSVPIIVESVDSLIKKRAQWARRIRIMLAWGLIVFGVVCAASGTSTSGNSQITVMLAAIGTITAVIGLGILVYGNI